MTGSARPVGPARPSQRPSPRRPGPRRVLIVDDGPSGLVAMRTVLAEAGYRVETRDSGAGAIEALASPFDLVVVDSALPDMTGPELCRLIAEVRAVPVILRSTLATGPGDRVAAMEAGADAHLVEPFDAEVLVATVRSVLRSRELDERLELAARRNDAMVRYVEALMATSTLAEGRSTVRRRGPEVVGADLVDIEWVPAEDELDRGDVAPRTILRRPELRDAPTGGPSEYVRLDGGGDPAGAADEEVRLVAVHRVTTPAGTGRVAVGWDDPPELGDGDRRFLELFAGLSISGLRQLSDYERHLHIGLTLQRALLPRIGPVEGLEVAVSYQPATEASLIGGDWYDVFDVRPGLVAVAIGDIAGHGIAASAAASAMRHTMRTALSAVEDVGEAMRIVDRLVSTGPVSTGPVPTSGTAALLLLDRVTGEAGVVLAGHPPPLIRTAGGATRYVEARPHPLLGFGLWAELEVEVHPLPIGPDDIVVLFTDGAVERRDRSLDVGLDELARVVADLDRPEEIVDVVVERNDPELAALSDDTIVLAIRLAGQPRPK